MCMMMADTMEALGIRRGDYVIRVNNRKVLDGVMEAIGLGGDDKAGQRLNVLRAIDKLDKFGPEGVKLLLGEGRKDESGDFTKGAGLSAEAIGEILQLINATSNAEAGDWNDAGLIDALEQLRFEVNSISQEGIAELPTMQTLFSQAGYSASKIASDTSCFRGIDTYIGPVFKATPIGRAT